MNPYVIFDMDGLLSESANGRVIEVYQLIASSIYTDVTNTMLQRYHCKGKLTWAMKAEQMGKPALTAAQSLFAHFPGLIDKISYQRWIEERNALQAEAFKSTRLMRGALPLVTSLAEAGVPIAIATGSNMSNFAWKTSHLPEVFALFPPKCIISADSEEVKRGKPYPDIYLAAARSLGQDVGDVDSCSEVQKRTRAMGIVFEDAIPGVLAGVSAGMRVFWVPDDSLRALNPEENYGATEVLSHLDEFDPKKWGIP